MAKKDKYDKNIDEIVSGDVEILDSWMNADPLFQFCGDSDCGCLTMIRGGDSGPRGFTQAIRRDTRIPRNPSIMKDRFLAAKTKSAKRKFLQPFAEWQRRLDRVLPDRIQQQKESKIKL